MRIIAMITTYNEANFVKACLDNYDRQGVEVYVLDNESTDETMDILNTYRQRNLIDIEIVRRAGVKNLRHMLMLKESLADQLKADWLMHADIDEICVASQSSMTISEEVELADKEGFNAINFFEYTFIPTNENPRHNAENFQQTMLWYYPYLPRYPNRRNLWKKQSRKWPGLQARMSDLIQNRRLQYPSIDLCKSGGHQVQFPNLRMYPVDLKMKHYLILNIEHAIEKYVKIKCDPKAPSGYHGWRATAAVEDFTLPSEKNLRLYTDDDHLDSSSPLNKHLIIK